MIINNDNNAFPTCQAVLHDLDDCNEIIIFVIVCGFASRLMCRSGLVNLVSSQR